MSDKPFDWKLTQDSKTGIWSVDFTVANKRHRKQTGEQDQVKAAFKAQELYSQAQKATKPVHTIQEAFDLRFTDQTQLISEATKSCYSDMVKPLTEYFHLILKLKTVQEIKSEHLHGFIEHRQGTIGKRSKKPVTDHTIHKELSALKSAMNTLFSRGFLEFNPSTLFPKFTAKYKPKDSFLSQAQIKTILDSLAPHRAAHVAFILATGMRWGESVRALRSDITDQVEGGYLVSVQGTKTARSLATIPVIQSFQVSLLEFALENAPSHEGLALFPAWTGMGQALTNAGKPLGFPRLSANDLRRTSGHILFQAGLTVEYIAQFLRHSSVQMAYKVYAKPTGRELADRMRAVLSGTSPRLL